MASVSPGFCPGPPPVQRLEQAWHPPGRVPPQCSQWEQSQSCRWPEVAPTSPQIAARECPTSFHRWPGGPGDTWVRPRGSSRRLWSGQGGAGCAGSRALRAAHQPSVTWSAPHTTPGRRIGSFPLTGASVTSSSSSPGSRPADRPAARWTGLCSSPRTSWLGGRSLGCPVTLSFPGTFTAMAPNDMRAGRGQGVLLPFVTDVRAVNTSAPFSKLIHARAAGTTITGLTVRHGGLGLQVTETVV